MADDKMTRTCRYCGRTEWPYCMNSRDMEDFAIDGEQRCYEALERQGGGEKGMRYVTLNRDDVARRRQEIANGR